MNGETEDGRGKGREQPERNEKSYFYHSCSAFKYFQKQDLMLFEFYLASFEHLKSAYFPSNWKPFDSGCAMGHANLLLNRQE